MNDDPQTAPGGALSLERVVFFSDAVFAIAITLLVLEIHVPRLPLGASPHDFAAELSHLLPAILGFVLSFVVIGLFWMGHHRLFSHARHFDNRVMWPNMLFLMTIAFMPFATAFMSANGNRFVAALVYNLTLLACGIAIWWLARRVSLMTDTASARSEMRRTAVTVGAALLCVALTFVIPQWSQVGMLLTIFGRRWADAGGVKA